jgi:hypothetical protein
MRFGRLEIHTLIHLLVVVIYRRDTHTTHPAREADIYNFFIFIFIYLLWIYKNIHLSKKLYASRPALFVWLIIHHPAVLFSQNKSATNKQYFSLRTNQNRLRAKAKRKLNLIFMRIAISTCKGKTKNDLRFATERVHPSFTWQPPCDRRLYLLSGDLLEIKINSCSNSKKKQTAQTAWINWDGPSG